MKSFLYLKKVNFGKDASDISCAKFSSISSGEVIICVRRSTVKKWPRMTSKFDKVWINKFDWVSDIPYIQEVNELKFSAMKIQFLLFLSDSRHSYLILTIHKLCVWFCQDFKKLWLTSWNIFMFTFNENTYVCENREKHCKPTIDVFVYMTMSAPMSASTWNHNASYFWQTQMHASLTYSKSLYCDYAN